MRPEHWLFTIPLRLRSWFRWALADQELDDELRNHLERKTEEFICARDPAGRTERIFVSSMLRVMRSKPPGGGRLNASELRPSKPPGILALENREGCEPAKSRVIR